MYDLPNKQYLLIYNNIIAITAIMKQIQSFAARPLRTEASPKNHHRISSVINDLQNKKLTHGLKTYQQIQDAHMKAHRNGAVQGKAKDNQECTFQPKVNPTAKNKRSLNKFLKDQEKFLLAKEEKINQMRTQINKTQEDEHTGRPTIDKMSQHLTNNLNSTIRSTNIFDRLSREKTYSNVTQEQQLFTPKILNRSKSMIRKQNVSVLLYEDAKRRKQKEAFQQNQQVKKRDISPKINQNTNALVGKKVCSQFTELVSEEQVNPIVAISVLSQIFNVDLNPNKGPASEKLCQKILSYLIEDKKQIVKSERLWDFIQTIINGHLLNSSFSCEQENQIIANFQYFYTQRLTKEKKVKSPQKHPFKPKTLTNSQRYAENYRQKTCEAINDFIEHQKINIVLKDGNMRIQDLFIIDHMKRQVSNQKKRIQKENKEMQECSFKPDVSPSKSTLKYLNKKPKIIIKAPPRPSLRQKPINQNERQESLQNTQKTLKSIKNHSRNKSNSKMNDSFREVKNMDKVVMRMSIGRQNRQYQHKYMERGYPKDQNWVNYRNQAHKNIIESHQNLKGYGNVNRI